MICFCITDLTQSPVPASPLANATGRTEHLDNSTGPNSRRLRRAMRGKSGWSAVVIGCPRTRGKTDEPLPRPADDARQRRRGERRIEQLTPPEIDALYVKLELSCHPRRFTPSMWFWARA